MANYPSVPRSNTAAGACAPITDFFNFMAPSNTGVPTGFDLDNNGSVGAPGTLGGANDSFGGANFVIAGDLNRKASSRWIADPSFHIAT
jgi:hypothetical protein